MMKTKIGINGFGRMGRLAFRAAYGRPEIEVVHINELKGGSATAAHLLKFDSIHGQWPHQVLGDNGELRINEDTAIQFSEASKPGEIDWKRSGARIVIESTGKFRTRALLEPYLKRGIEKVVVAAPVKENALNLVMGVNDQLYRAEEHDIVTAASCTTNCLAPVVKVIHEGLGIKHGMITTLHDVTNTQTVVDAPHKDLRRARSSSISLIPTTTGSATAIGLIYPELSGRLNGIAVRVPLLNASLTDCVFEVDRPTTVAEVNAFLKAAAEGKLAGILGFEERPLVSVDFKDDPRSGIIDALSTMVVNGTQVKILIWYDNEWGYANRLVELVIKLAASLAPK
jgi:glyceraldehyde-3-phosphate dehydrogenase (arsenate-transferring)